MTDERTQESLTHFREIILGNKAYGNPEHKCMEGTLGTKDY